MELPHDWAPAAKALAAACAGRVLLLLKASREAPIGWRAVVKLAIWETPLIAAFALVGWHAAEVVGADTESGRIVVTALLAHVGVRGLDALVVRVLAPRNGNRSDADHADPRQRVR